MDWFKWYSKKREEKGGEFSILWNDERRISSVLHCLPDMRNVTFSRLFSSRM